MDTKTQLDALYAYTKEKLASDKTGHDLAHIDRVLKLAKELAKNYQVDRFVVLAAATLHDVVDDKLFADPKQAQKEVVAKMTALKITQEKQAEILEIITHMSYASSLNGKYQLSLAGQIVRDADWLDALGAIGITRAIYYGAVHQEKIYDPKILPRKALDKTEYRNLANETIINHFYEKLLKLPELLNTPEAKVLARPRQQIMLDFLAAFKAEW